MPFSPDERAECERLIRWGLAEDLGGEIPSQAVGDITSRAILEAGRGGAAVLVLRKQGVVAGLESLVILTQMHGQGIRVEQRAPDGPAEAGAVLASLHGPGAAILEIERLGLNLLGRLSGTATLTAQFVRAVAGTPARIYDTRKTIPGWRRLQKYAVRVGGGANHRQGLFDAVLIKDNHLAALVETEGLAMAEAISRAVARARAATPPGTFVQVEVDLLDQLDAALAAGPDAVLLDNMNPQQIQEAVARRDRLLPKVQLEASGGITLDNVRAIAEAGVDRISVGALTHSAPALDLALDYSSLA